MKKFFVYCLVGIAILIFIANLGPLIYLGIGGALLYFITLQYMKATSTGAKVLWVIGGFVVASSMLANVSAIIGLAALYLAYVLFKSLKDTTSFENNQNQPTTSDPFRNFENQWAELKK